MEVCTMGCAQGRYNCTSGCCACDQFGRPIPPSPVTPPFIRPIAQGPAPIPAPSPAPSPSPATVSSWIFWTFFAVVVVILLVIAFTFWR